MATQESLVEPLFGTAQIAARDNVNAIDVLFDANASTWEVANPTTLQTSWNSLFPYQLLILERVNGVWEACKRPNVPSPFTLPIPPQTLNIDMNFAAQVEATQGGVIEQFTQSRFREISLTGTTGVLPLRGAVERPTKLNIPQSIATGIFAGTIISGQSGITAGNQIRNAVQLPATTPGNVIPNSAFADVGPNSPAFGTGYYQFLLLKRFLEWYDLTKAKKSAQNLALGFAVWKEKEVYIVTPQKFTVSRVANKAMEYPYSITLRAWKRVILKDSKVGSLTNHQFVGRDPNLYAQLLNTLTVVRRTLENARDTLEAVRADVNNVVFGTLRQVVLLSKDVLGVGFAVADFNNALTAQFKGPLLEKIGAAGSGTLPSNDQLAATFNLSQDDMLKDRELGQLVEELRLLSVQSQKNKTSAGSAFQATEFEEQNNGLGGSPVNDAFRNPDRWFNFFGNLSVSSLPIRPTTVLAMEEAREAVRNLRREDFERQRNQLQAVLDDFSIAVGVGDPTVSAIYNLPERSILRSKPTDQDWEVMGALNEAIQSMDALAASSSINNQDTSTPLDLIAGLARSNGIAFTRPVSKFLVPFPYGYTLEQVSERYLGDPNRWIEIAALNGLRAPYVDEIGFVQDFLTNGTANQISVADGSNFYAGQPIWITGIGVKREKRRVTGVKKLNENLWLISVDGAADLHRFTVVNEAFVQAFLPDTVNSLQFLYIPSQENVDSDWLTKSIPGVDTFDPMFRIGGADLLLSHTGDLVITGDGTTRLAVGLNNLIQRLRIAVATPRGSLLGHPDFGFGIRGGTSTAEVSAQQILEAAKAFVNNEEGFSGVDYAAVQKRANGLTISMSVGIRGSSKAVPITVELR